MNSRDFGVTDDPYEEAAEDVRPYVGLTPRERWMKFLDLMAFMERIWKSLDPQRRAQYERAYLSADDSGRWWERIPSQ